LFLLLKANTYLFASIPSFNTDETADG